MDIISRMLALMAQKNLTKYELHKLSGVSKSTIYNMFNPKINSELIKLENVRAIAETLGTTLDYLVYGECQNRIVIDTTDYEHYDFRVSSDTIKKVLALLGEEETPE
jgi:transcriptional regulator with XRE-family HTH domain